MDAFVFAHIVRLRAGPDQGEMLELLPPRHRAEAAAALERTNGLSREELGLRLDAYRLVQRGKQHEAAGARLGIALDRLSPRLAEWLARPF